MSDHLGDSGNVGILVSVGSVIGSLLSILAFWTKFSDRITNAHAAAKLADEKARLADQKAESAQQEAAEAKNDLENFRVALDTVTREVERRNASTTRDVGEALAAIRQHVTEMGFFMRDNFARKDEFSAAIAEIKAGQLRTDSKIDGLREQMRGTHK